MNSFKEIKEKYDKIRLTLNEARTDFEKARAEGYQPEKLKEVNQEILGKVNVRLKQQLNEFFAAYEKITLQITDEAKKWSRVNTLPYRIESEGKTEENDQTGMLKRIETLLERQNVTRMLERMHDEEVITTYKNAVRTADRLRNSLINRIKAGEINPEEANNILKTDSSVSTASLIEEEAASLLRKRPSKKILKDIISSNQTKRQSGHRNEETRKNVDTLHSSVCFLLRDMSDANLKIRDWQTTDRIILDLEDRQVEYFLDQSEKNLAADEKNSTSNDNKSNDAKEEKNEKD